MLFGDTTKEAIVNIQRELIEVTPVPFYIVSVVVMVIQNNTTGAKRRLASGNIDGARL